jgi:hypothetical protein
VSEVASKFDFRMVFSPVPETGDFRVNVSNDALAEMQESYASAFDSRLGAIKQEPWNRLHDMLLGMAEKMTEDEGPRYRNRKNKDGETIRQEIKRPYHESFVTNADALVDMLKHLNVTNDPVLERARLALSDAMFGVDIDVIRESPATRADIKAKVDAILVAAAPTPEAPLEPEFPEPVEDEPEGEPEPALPDAAAAPEPVKYDDW